MTKKLILILLVIFGFMFWLFEFDGHAGATHYCDLSTPGKATDGSDTGTFAAPFESITQVNAHTFADGDDLYFLAGAEYTMAATTNDDGVVVNWTGLLGDTSVIGCYTDETTFTCTKANRPKFIGNLVMDAGTDVPTGSYLGMIHITRTNEEAEVVEHVTIQDLHFYKTAGYGVFINQQSWEGLSFYDIIIQRCTINKWDRGATYHKRTVNCVVQDCEMWDGPIDNTFSASNFFTGDDKEDVSYGNIFRRNLIYQLFEPLDLGKKTRNNIVEYNTVIDSHDVGFYVASARNNHIRYNLIYRSDEWASESYDRSTAGYFNGIEINNEDTRNYCFLGGNKIYGNIISGTGNGIRVSNSCGSNNEDEPYTNCTAACWQQLTPVIYNNTFVDNGTNIKFGTWTANTGVNSSNIVIKNNLSVLFTGSLEHVSSETINGVSWDTNQYYGSPVVTGEAATNAIATDPDLNTESGYRYPTTKSLTGVEFSIGVLSTSRDAALTGTGYDYRINDTTTTDYSADPIVVSIEEDSDPDIGAWMYPATSDTNPVVVITSPTSNPTYQTDTQTITLTGTATDDSSVSSVAWTCPTCTVTSGACSGTATWTCPDAGSITLGSTDNVITVTATDDTSNTGPDVLTVTYPIPIVLPLQGAAGNFKYN